MNESSTVAPSTADGESGPAPAADRPRPWWLLLGRGLVLLALIGYCAAGLVHNHLGGKYNRYLPGWKMFGSTGLEQSQVEYWIEAKGGGRQVVDPYAILELERSYRSPQVYRLRGRKAAAKLGRQLCRELGDGVDLRMKVRTAKRDGWKVEARGKTNLCKPKKPKPKPKKPKKAT